MHSFQLLTAISGNPVWADRCEQVALNSFPAAMTGDLKGLRYLTCPNLVQADRQNKSPGFDNGGTQLSYSPFKVYRCCQHNVSHGWPYFAENLWLATADNGVCVSLYAASQVDAKVGDGTPVKIALDTDYPFDQTLRFKVSRTKEVRFPLYLRVPRWSGKPVVAIDGARKSPDGDGPYLRIEKTWKDGDTFSVEFPAGMNVHIWEKNKNAASISYGPLEFSLKIGERWQRYGGTDEWPEWEVFPTTPWNYGLVLDERDPARSLQVTRKPGPIAEQPFTPDAAPIEIRAPAKKIPGWKMDKTGLVGVLQASPVKSDEPVETIALIPMGAARLRISMFPTIGTGPAAHEWVADEQRK